MRAQIDNATATPNKARGGLPERDVTPDVTCHVALERGRTAATLGDGRTMPSENDATLAASTKLPKLMDTLSDPIRIGILLALTKEGSGATRAKDLSDGTSRCYVLLRIQPSPSKLTLVDGHARPSKIVATPSASTKVEKLMGTLSAYFAPKRRQLKVTL